MLSNLTARVITVPLGLQVVSMLLKMLLLYQHGYIDLLAQILCELLPKGQN